MFAPLLPLARRLHFYAGLLIAPFLLVATISGGLYALAPTAEQVVYRQLLHTNTSGPHQPVAAQVANVRSAHPGAPITGVDVASKSGETTRVYLADATLGDSERRTVFVDPASSAILGESVSYGSNGALPLRTWIAQLHRDLHLGDAGRMYSELAASWLWVVALGGLILWVSRFRTPRRNTGTSWWRLGVVDRARTSRGRTLNWHGAVGVWLVVALVFLSATGLTWSRYAGANIAEMRTALNWERPTLATEVPHSGHHGPATTTAPLVLDDKLDSVVATARARGLDGRIEITVPTTADEAIAVAQVRQPWRFSADALAIDSQTLAVTAELPFAAWSWPAKLTDWAIQLHMGILFGWVSALVLFLLMAALITVIVRGYLLWWRRGAGDRPGHAPARGAWRTAASAASRPARAAIAAVVIGAVVVGWFVPLLGIPLLAFLLVDTALGRIRREPASPARPPSRPRTYTYR